MSFASSIIELLLADAANVRRILRIARLPPRSIQTPPVRGPFFTFRFVLALRASFSCIQHRDIIGQTSRFGIVFKPNLTSGQGEHAVLHLLPKKFKIGIELSVVAVLFLWGVYGIVTQSMPLLQMTYISAPGSNPPVGAEVYDGYLIVRGFWGVLSGMAMASLAVSLFLWAEWCPYHNTRVAKYGARVAFTVTVVTFVAIIAFSF